MTGVSQFSRRTILAAVDILAGWGYHVQVDRFVLEHGLENVVGGGSIAAKAHALSGHLIENTDALNEDGENLADVVVGQLVADAIRRSTTGYPREFDLGTINQNYQALNRGFERDGFTVEGGELVLSTKSGPPVMLKGGPPPR